ncbi:MAG: hypothetical protein ACHQJD_01440 [Thermoanaerobaculia bacterium]
MATDLKAFQARLNSDKALRAEFLKDPVKSFETVDLILPEEAKERLTKLAAEMARKHRPAPGSSLSMKPWEIKIIFDDLH